MRNIKIPKEKIIKGNILIARFHGMYYRNDWQEKFPNGYFVRLDASQKTTDGLKDRDILQVGIRFRYHDSWALLIESWLSFQNVWKAIVHDPRIEQTEYWQDFTQGMLLEDKLLSWKGLAKGAYRFIDTHWEQSLQRIIYAMNSRNPTLNPERLRDMPSNQIF